MLKSFSTTIFMRGVGWVPFFSFWGGGGDYYWFQVLLESKAEIALFKIELEFKLRVLSCFKQVEIL
jgi:hypothetical protein